MGQYVNETQNGRLGSNFTQKCEGLLEAGAVEIAKPKEVKENLICVVDNGIFGAAAYIYNQNELDAFSDPQDKRFKRFFVWDKVSEYAK
jgi:hypothetical protein